MTSWLKAAAFGVGGIAVAGLATLVAFQERLVYVPVLPGLPRAYAVTPSRFEIDYEDVWLRSSDGVRLHAWFLKHSPPVAGPTILFFQENAGSILKSSSMEKGCLLLQLDDIGHRLDFVRMMMQRLHCNVFMLSYRGYGASDGHPSQAGITIDAQAALDHLSERSDVDTSRIVVFGRSLGGAVGSVLAFNNPDKVSALILENTFTSILDMTGVMLPFLRFFIGGSASNGPKILNFLVRSPWSTVDVIGKIKQPILFLSGLQDELVPPLHMRLLYEKAAEKNTKCLFVGFPDGMHMDTWYSGGDRYWRTVQLFLEQNVPRMIDGKLSSKDEDEDDGRDCLQRL